MKQNKIIFNLGEKCPGMIHKFGCLPQVVTICRGQVTTGRFDGGRHRFGVVWFGLIVARMGATPQANSFRKTIASAVAYRLSSVRPSSANSRSEDEMLSIGKSASSSARSRQRVRRSVIGSVGCLLVNCSTERGAKPLEVCHHLQHLCLIDCGVVPLHPISSLPQHPSDLTIGHATDEFLPGGLIGAAVLNTCLGSVVEEFIIADPKGNVPGLVICPTVVGAGGHGREVVWFFLILQATQPPEGGQVDSLRTGSVAPGFGHPMRCLPGCSAIHYHCWHD